MTEQQRQAQIEDLKARVAALVRIRNFGFLANRKRATLLPLCFQLLGSQQPPQAAERCLLQ